MSLAIVLPALNEAAVLLATLRSLLGQSRRPDRIVVVDGGSVDETADIARASGAEVLAVAGRGRGGQIAASVAACTEDIVVVAHADMRFPPTALEAVEQYLEQYPACPGGCLGHVFDRPRRVVRCIEWWDRRRAQSGDSYGDQAQFFRREQLNEVGGFPDLPLMEDVELARRLRRLGRPAYLDVPVVVSARRYERLGWPRVAWMNWRLRRQYRRDGEAGAWAAYRRYYGAE